MNDKFWKGWDGHWPTKEELAGMLIGAGFGVLLARCFTMETLNAPLTDLSAGFCMLAGSLWSGWLHKRRLRRERSKEEAGA